MSRVWALTTASGAFLDARCAASLTRFSTILDHPSFVLCTLVLRRPGLALHVTIGTFWNSQKLSFTFGDI